ncbi:STAS-like domain-containing protein [Candidatus Gracilibacteria bacterium]|nr:STAS-like domain-containing protein [Candidatus Gracilibacteria bacterium]
MIQDTINIATDFSDVPAGRYYTDGDTSGQKFYETILRDKFDNALLGNYEIDIILDGVWGLPPSFLSASFGELSTLHGSEKVLRHLHFTSNDEDPTNLEDVLNEIRNPEAR